MLDQGNIVMKKSQISDILKLARFNVSSVSLSR